TLLTGDYWGIAVAPNGDFWFGGGNRLGKKAAGENPSGNLWAATQKIDVWPDAVPMDAYPDQRTDDLIQDAALMPDGSIWVGSIKNSLAHVGADGTVLGYVNSGMVDKKVTALETDPKDGSLWVGHIWGGVTRLSAGTAAFYDRNVFGSQAIDGQVIDIQSDRFQGTRRILFAFDNGALGVYTGN